MKELITQNTQRAIETREAFKNARQGYDPDASQMKSKRKLPKKLQNVESVIKKRIEVDREISRKNKQNNASQNIGVEILVPNQNNREIVEQPQKKSANRSARKNKSYRDVNYQDEEIGNTQAPQSNRNSKPLNTEGSSYPSVTQASAPPPEYFRDISGPKEERKDSNYPKHKSVYRPKSNSKGQIRENNVVEITEGFLNSPMMTQFSDNSELKRQPYVNIDSKDNENRRNEQKDYSGYNDSNNYGYYQQNRSNESIYGQQNPYENPTHGYQLSNGKNAVSNPVTSSNPNYSRFYEDQVLFKSNGFDGNGTSSGKANDSAMLQSPEIRNQRNTLTSDSKLTGTANFERPQDYDAKYSDYRDTDSQNRTYNERNSYEQRPNERESQPINPFKSRFTDGNYNYQPSYGNQNTNYSNQPAGSYKYEPRWEGNEPSLNSPEPYSMNTSGQVHGPPKYLEPHEESKYNSQYDEDEEEESDYEGEESESEYDSEISKTDGYRSNSSLSNYAVQDRMYQRDGQQYSMPKEQMQYQDRNQRQYQKGQYYPSAQTYSGVYQSMNNPSDRNPQIMSSIGSDYSGNLPHFQQQVDRNEEQNQTNPYAMYQNYVPQR